MKSQNDQYSSIFTTSLTPTAEYPYEGDTHHSGSFVPPLPIVLRSTWQGGQIVATAEEDFIQVTPPPPKKQRGGKRNTGGRKPNNSRLTPEEDERRKIRRERNKLAAARCRKRRVDQTNTLLEETEELEQTKRSIQKQINDLETEREELEFILQAHNSNCSRMNSKSTKLQQQQQQQQESQQQQQQSREFFVPSASKKPRPNTLPVIPANTGITLSTPSNGFDLDWGDLPSTGLTPTAMTPLVTPSTVNAILNSLNSNNVNVKSEFVEL